MSRRRQLLGEGPAGRLQTDNNHLRRPPAMEWSWLPRTKHIDLKHSQESCPTNRAEALGNPDREYCIRSDWKKHQKALSKTFTGAPRSCDTPSMAYQTQSPQLGSRF